MDGRSTAAGVPTQQSEAVYQSRLSTAARRRARATRLRRSTLPIVLIAGVAAAGSGCALMPPHSFLDPTKVGVWGMKAKEKGIRRILLPGRESLPGLANASEPTPEDLAASYEDYRIVPSDIIQILIPNLLEPGVPFSVVSEVSSAGELRIPTVGSIKVVGLTESELEQEIKAAIESAQRLTDPVIYATIQGRRGRTFTITGSVGLAGQYPITDPDMRLAEAIGLARDAGPEAKKLYVIRRSGKSAANGTDANRAPENNGLIIPPDDGGGSQAGFFATAGLNMQDSQPGRRDDRPTRDELDELLSPSRRTERPADTQEVRRESNRPFAPLIFDPKTGQRLEDQPKPPPVEPPAAEKPEGEKPGAEKPAAERPFSWEDLPQYELSQRVIEIDLSALRAGDPRFNIVVRDRDWIQVPIDVGVIYIMGEVNRPGVYALNGREVTVKQAIGGLAGGFSPLAWPSRCELIRREPGTDKQITIPINLDAIFAGVEEDFFLKDDDVINVGSDVVAPFLFVIRNSFRFTYGFGFVYDRNFADKDAYGARLNPEIIAENRRARRGLPF